MKLANNNDGITFGTNILDIEVPARLRIKVPSGLSYVDEAMGGQGFTPSAVTLFTGEPGSGKTTLMLTLADKFTKKGNIVLFNTAEESLYQTSMTAGRLGLKNGFMSGNTNDINALLDGALKIIEAKENKGKQLVLIVDSLQCMDDGKYSSGTITSGTAIRCLTMITDFCKEHSVIGIIINQVNKAGKMAGSNKLKHMVDAHMHLGIEQKDVDLLGCRVLETQKNRFGGCGHVFFLQLGRKGFRQIAKVSSY